MIGLIKQECSMHDDMCFETPAMCQDCEEIGWQEYIAHNKNAVIYVLGPYHIF